MSNPPVISIVDDDASIRAATDNLLRSLGYTVMKAGAICFLTKPFDRRALIKCLDTALRRDANGTGK